MDVANRCFHDLKQQNMLLKLKTARPSIKIHSFVLARLQSQVRLNCMFGLWTRGLWKQQQGTCLPCMFSQTKLQEPRSAQSHPKPAATFQTQFSCSLSGSMRSSSSSSLDSASPAMISGKYFFTWEFSSLKRVEPSTAINPQAALSATACSHCMCSLFRPGLAGQGIIE